MSTRKLRGLGTPRGGCLLLGGALAIIALVAGVLSGVAFWQNRSNRPEPQSLSLAVPETSQGAAPKGDTILRLNVSTATVTLQPAAAGTAIQVEAGFDPTRFTLNQEQRQQGSDRLYLLELRPSGTEAMALLRVKLGGDMPTLRIRVPRDVRLSLEGELTRSFIAVELGGLHVDSTRLIMNQGSVHLSCNEPLQAPMRELSVSGKQGSMTVVGLGNASPLRVSLEQRVGALALDLRGSWANDSQIDISGRFAGGTLWLPEGVAVEGLPDGPRGLVVVDPELPVPKLRVSVHDRLGRFVILD